MRRARDRRGIREEYGSSQGTSVRDGEVRRWRAGNEPRYDGCDSTVRGAKFGSDARCQRRPRFSLRAIRVAAAMTARAGRSAEGRRAAGCVLNSSRPSKLPSSCVVFHCWPPRFSCSVPGRPFRCWRTRPTRLRRPTPRPSTASSAPASSGWPSAKGPRRSRSRTGAAWSAVTASICVRAWPPRSRRISACRRCGSSGCRSTRQPGSASSPPARPTPSAGRRRSR